MFDELLPPQAATTGALLIPVTIGAVCLYLAFTYYARGLYRIPGPFPAKFTNVWRLVDVGKRRHQETIIALHRKYGDIVRLGPQCLSVADPAAMESIYGVNKGFAKTNFYMLADHVRGLERISNLFSDRDEKHHALYKKPVSASYSMSAIVEFEPFVDEVIKMMVRRLEEEFCQPKGVGRICDMASWLQYYAFDVVGEVTFSSPLGFLERGEDVDGLMHQQEKLLDYTSLVGQMPFLDYLLAKNPLLRFFSYQPQPLVIFAMSLIHNRQSRIDYIESSRKDFLAHFLETKETYPDIVKDDGQVLSYLMMNLVAGSDTTAISLRAILYYTLKTPAVHERLLAEVDAMKSGTNAPVSWKSSQARPYLDAVIKEAFRIHPAVGMSLERTVPDRGLKLPDGTEVPPGTIVGMNAWVIHRNEDIFGPNVDVFDPSRWLRREKESEEGFQARLARMNRTMMHFGKGARSCLGKNISLLEVYKVIPTLFERFKMRLAEPDKDWELANSFFVMQKGIDVILKNRDG